MQHALLIAAACTMALLATVGGALPYPILPPLFASGAVNGLNTFMDLPPKLLLGVALAINPLGLLIGSAVLGPLSDRFGRRRMMLLASFGAAAGHALSALALVIESYPLFLFARFATGLLEGRGAVARALLADRLSGALRLRAMSWLNGAFYMGWLVGPLLAAATLGFGLTVPFWIAAGALLLSAALVAVALPVEPPSSATTSWWQVARDEHSLNLLRHGELRRLFIVHLALTCGVTAFYEFYPLWLVEVAAYEAQDIALITAVMCAVMTSVSLFAGRPGTVAPLRLASWNALGVAIAVGTVAVADAGAGMAAIVLFGLPMSYYNAVVPGWCAERFGGHGHGAVMGLLSTTFCLANILMAIAGSVLALVDTRLVLALGAALAAWASWKLQCWHGEMAAVTIKESRQ